VLLAEDGGHFDNPDRGIAYRVSGRTWVNNHAHVLRPRRNIDINYLCRVLENYDVKPFVTGTTRGKLTKGGASEIPIPLPPLPEQRRIAAVLDKADALRAKRRETLAQLDDLTQSIFIEMFGDPVANPKGWPITKVASFLLDVTNGLTRRRSEVEDGEHIVLRLRDIRSESIDFSTPNRITLNEKEKAKYQVSPGELLFIRVNGNPEYVGRCALFEGHPEQVFFNDHVMRVRLKAGLTGGYLSHFLNRPEGKKEIAKHRKTSARQHTINQDGLGAIALPLPDESLQNQFLDRVFALRKMASVQIDALDKLGALFTSLQHRAFRGEL
jgi:type I restriction enzyme S subunit